MKSLFSFFFIFNFIYLLNTSSSLASVDLEAGEKIFTANCAACHAGGNNVIMPGKTLNLVDLEEYSMNSIDAITTQVTNGKTAMPAFGGRLSDDDIQNVAEYVLGQSKAGW